MNGTLPAAGVSTQTLHNASGYTGMTMGTDNARGMQPYFKSLSYYITAPIVPAGPFGRILCLRQAGGIEPANGWLWNNDSLLTPRNLMRSEKITANPNFDFLSTDIAFVLVPETLTINCVMGMALAYEDIIVNAQRRLSFPVSEWRMPYYYMDERLGDMEQDFLALARAVITNNSALFGNDADILALSRLGILKMQKGSYYTGRGGGAITVAEIGEAKAIASLVLTLKTAASICAMYNVPRVV
jgi:hypothetical protein